MIYIDFDGHQEVTPDWGTIDAAAAVFTNLAKYSKAFNVVAELYRPFNINVTTKESVFNAAAANRRQRVVVTKSDVVSGSGIAELYAFSKTNGPSAFVESSGMSAKELGQTIAHEMGHALGLKHDGTAANNSVSGYHSTANWAPVLGSNFTVGQMQWNNGDYDEANNAEDDIAIIIGAPNNIELRNDDHGDRYTTATALAFSGNTISNSNEGLIEYMTDYDVWTFKTTGGTSSISVASFTAYPVLEVGGVLHNLDDGTSYTFTKTANLGLTFSGTLTAGNYILSIYSGIHFTGRFEGPTNYGSLGSYAISGTVPSLSAADANPTDFSFDVISPSLSTVYLEADDKYKALYSIRPVNNSNASFKVWIDNKEYTMTASGQDYVFEMEEYLNAERSVTFVMEQDGQAIDTTLTVSYVQEKVKPITHDHITIMDFSAEMPDGTIIAPGLAAWAIDGDTSTSWANELAFDSQKNAWVSAPFPHYMDIEFDSVYDVSALVIIPKESVISFSPDKYTLRFDYTGDGTWDQTYTNTFEKGINFQAWFPTLNGSTMEVKKMQIGFSSTFGQTEGFTIGEILPYKRLSVKETQDNTSIDNSEVGRGVNVYPNPSKALFYLSESSSYKVFNMQGQLVLEGTGKEINLSAAQTGMYLLQLEDGTSQTICKY